MRSEVYKGAGGGTWEVYVFYSCRFITDRASVILSLIICFSSSYLGNLNHTVWHTMHIHWYQRLSCLQDDVLCGWCLFCSSRLWVHAVVKYLEAAKELAEVSPPVLCGKNGGIKKNKKNNYNSHQSFLPCGMLGLFWRLQVFNQPWNATGHWSVRQGRRDTVKVNH